MYKLKANSLLIQSLLRFYFIIFCQMCKGDSSVMVETGDENIALLNQLKRSNPEKFKK